MLQKILCQNLNKLKGLGVFLLDKLCFPWYFDKKTLCPGCFAHTAQDKVSCFVWAPGRPENIRIYYFFFFPLMISIQNDSVMIHSRRNSLFLPSWRWELLNSGVNDSGIPLPGSSSKLTLNIFCTWSFMDAQRSFLGNPWVLWQWEKSVSFLIPPKVKSPPTLQPACARAEIILHLKALTGLCPAASGLGFFNLNSFVSSLTVNFCLSIACRFIGQPQKSKERKGNTDKVLKNQNFNWNNGFFSLCLGKRKKRKRILKNLLPFLLYSC